MNSAEARMQRGGQVLFEFSFHSAMAPSERELLRRELDMVMHVDHKLSVDPDSDGHARLDRDAALFLDPVDEAGGWRLQARSWGQPPARTVEGWRLRSGVIAHMLDPSVPLETRVRVLPPAPVQHRRGFRRRRRREFH